MVARQGDGSQKVSVHEDDIQREAFSKGAKGVASYTIAASSLESEVPIEFCSNRTNDDLACLKYAHAVTKLLSENRSRAHVHVSSTKDFEVALRERDLERHDVRRTSEMATSAGIESILSFGPYRGLHYTTLARDFVAVV